MRIHKLPLGIGIFGVAISVASAYRWMVIWHDTSNALFGVAIGAVIALFAYIYNWMREVDEAIRKEKKQLRAIVDWFFKRSDDAIREQAMGIEVVNA